jgi:glucan biosynthesis protein C
MSSLSHKASVHGANSNAVRLAGLDAARGLLLVLGIILHAANVYTTGGKWVIADSQSSYFFNLLVDVIHEFRMPTFFWISGYFCALTCLRSGADKMLRRRLPRLLIPLLASWITLNVLQDGFVAWWRGQDPIREVLNGVPLFHLWFLVDLLFFIITAPLYLPCLRQLSERLKSRTIHIGTIPIVLVLGAFGYLLNLTARASGFAYSDILGITSLHRLSINIPFFIGGAFMYHHTRLKESFLSVPILALLVLVPIALLARNHLTGYTLIVQELNDLSEKVLIWACVGGCLNFFHTVFQRPTWLTRHLADASYTVFLFSHCLIVITGLFFAQTTLPVSMKFIFVSLISMIVATWVHVVLIRRFAWFRFCFNGH